MGERVADQSLRQSIVAILTFKAPVTARAGAAFRRHRLLRKLATRLPGSGEEFKLFGHRVYRNSQNIKHPYLRAFASKNA